MTIEGADAVGESLEAGSGRRSGAAVAVVADLDAKVAVALGDVDRRAMRMRVLRDVRERLGDDEVGGRGDVLGQSGRLARHGNGDRGARGKRPQGGVEP